MIKQPMQPIVFDGGGRACFQHNAIVSFLKDWARERGMTMNDMASMPFSQMDREQFTQLCGYDVDGFAELYPDSDAAKAADREVWRLKKVKKVTRKVRKS